ncbi:sigma-70 family RNA polymerase sigma factor [Actinoplanes friuliensis]|uniref:sigma-70 family RNA polymerase sigma factor n=1 Tax=Actinoplanes friuliensis TaxID=196914 RepID=UPI0030829327
MVTWDPHLAEDIIQNVLVRAQLRWGRIGRLDAPELYVKRMVVNEFLSLRRRRAANSVPLAAETLGGLLPPMPDPTAQRDDRDAMLRLIARLPPRQRAVIALRFYEDLAVDQIAEILGCRTVTVRTHLARALAALQQALPATLTTTGEKL